MKTLCTTSLQPEGDRLVRYIVYKHPWTSFKKGEVIVSVNFDRYCDILEKFLQPKMKKNIGSITTQKIFGSNKIELLLRPIRTLSLRNFAEYVLGLSGLTRGSFVVTALTIFKSM